jgi:predicted transcriptional regulator
MTRGVECIHPDDSLQMAAQRMKELDVGTLPVCGENQELVGMITDRDIAVRSVAEGYDPWTEHVGDAMTPNVVYCFENEDVDEAAKLMKENQVRRLTVLNQAKRLVGIVSLGDIARAANRELTGRTLRAVSEPGQRRRREKRKGQGASSLNRGIMLLAAACTGAGLAFMLDPVSGRRRRALTADKMRSMLHEVDDCLTAAGRDCNEASGRGRGLRIDDQLPGQTDLSAILLGTAGFGLALSALANGQAGRRRGRGERGERALLPRDDSTLQHRPYAGVAP